MVHVKLSEGGGVGGCRWVWVGIVVVGLGLE